MLHNLLLIYSVTIVIKATKEQGGLGAPCRGAGRKDEVEYVRPLTGLQTVCP